MPIATRTVDRVVSAARRRLLVQSLLNRLLVAWIASLSVGLGYLLAEPWLFEAPAAGAKWAVLGGTAVVTTLFAIVSAIRSHPKRDEVALELDARFGLRERLTTALTLAPRDADSPAGQAVVADATAAIAKLRVADRFPVRIGRQAAWLPVLAAGIAVAAIFYHPTVNRADATEPDSAKKTADAGKLAQTPSKPAVPFTKQKPQDPPDRGPKSEKLKELEGELDKLMEKYARDPDGDKPEKQREKVTEITNAEEKIKKFNQEQIDKLSQMDKQLHGLDKLKQDKDVKDGPAAGLNDALSKGDLQKAKEEVDELRKKAKDKQVDSQELAKGLDKMEKEVEKLARNQDRQDELKDLIDKAKKEGRDAESLERELEKVQQEAKETSEGLEGLGEALKRAKAAAEKGDAGELSRELDNLGKQLENVEGQLQDIEDAQEYLQRLKAEKEAACKKCNGQGEGENDELAKKGNKDGKGGTGQGSGERPINEKAETASQDERLKGLFDPRGKKSYGGQTRGPAFNKKTTAEFGKEIREAVQEAPSAADSQRLPRDARDAVKEYFQNLGGQAPPGK